MRWYGPRTSGNGGMTIRLFSKDIPIASGSSLAALISSVAYQLILTLPLAIALLSNTAVADDANYAPVILISSFFTFAAVTLYFPIKLYRTVRQNLPKIDEYTELGRARGRTETNHEYERVLARDDNPFSFLYQGESIARLSLGLSDRLPNEFLVWERKGYRRRWGAYRAGYLGVKLSVLVIVGSSLLPILARPPTAQTDRDAGLFSGLHVWYAVQLVRSTSALDAHVRSLLLQTTASSEGFLKLRWTLRDKGS
jgi:hypothetical protein